MAKRLKRGKRSAEVLVSKPKRKIIRRKKKPNNVVVLNEWLYKEVTTNKEMNKELESWREIAFFLERHNEWGTDYDILRKIYLEYKLGIKSSVDSYELYEDMDEVENG